MKAPLPDDPLAFVGDCLNSGDIRWTVHAGRRLGQRDLSASILCLAAPTLEIIESYPEDKYMPSFLFRGEAAGNIFHALIATDVAGHNIRVVTMYLPDPSKWENDFRMRRRVE